MWHDRGVAKTYSLRLHLYKTWRPHINPIQDATSTLYLRYICISTTPKMKDFAAIDFETANGKRSSVCSVGVVIVRNGAITDTIYSLIRPWPNYYSRFTTAIHGLTCSDTDDAPLFPEVWSVIAPRIEGLILVAHNSPFDEGCLKAAFRHELSGVSFRLYVQGLTQKIRTRTARPQTPHRSVTMRIRPERPPSRARRRHRLCTHCARHTVTHTRRNGPRITRAVRNRINDPLRA